MIKIKMLAVTLTALLASGSVAGAAHAKAGHPVPSLRDTNWPCAGC